MLWLRRPYRGRSEDVVVAGGGGAAALAAGLAALASLPLAARVTGVPMAVCNPVGATVACAQGCPPLVALWMRLWWAGWCLCGAGATRPCGAGPPHGGVAGWMRGGSPTPLAVVWWGAGGHRVVRCECAVWWCVCGGVVWCVRCECAHVSM